jgi:lactase-phlorizin hydrolase
MNLGYYRFSISWARVLPTGYADMVNQPGIDYYNRLIDGLLAEGIEPMVTLFHWDLPLQLQRDFDGFDKPDIIQPFADYAELCFNGKSNK